MPYARPSKTMSSRTVGADRRHRRPVSDAGTRTPAFAECQFVTRSTRLIWGVRSGEVSRDRALLVGLAWVSAMADTGVMELLDDRNPYLGLKSVKPLIGDQTLRGEGLGRSSDSLPP